MWTNTWTIAKKDFKSYFTSTAAYIVLGLFLFILGWMFKSIFQYYQLQTIQSLQYGFMNKGPNLMDGFFRPLFGNLNVVLLFLIPGLTMRMIAEEQKQHTIELLMTAPIRLSELVLGKFLAGFLFISLMLTCTLMYPLSVYLSGSPDLGPIFTSYLGTLLLSSCYIAFGLMFSAMTENQIVAFIASFVFNLFLWLINWAAESSNRVVGEILNYLSLIGHFNNFGQGLIVTSDIVFYLSCIGVGLFLAHRILDSYRWR